MRGLGLAVVIQSAATARSAATGLVQARILELQVVLGNEPGRSYCGGLARLRPCSRASFHLLQRSCSPWWLLRTGHAKALLFSAGVLALLTCRLPAQAKQFFVPLRLATCTSSLWPRAPQRQQPCTCLVCLDGGIPAHQ